MYHLIRRAIRTRSLIRTEVVLKWVWYIWYKLKILFNKNRSCIEIDPAPTMIIYDSDGLIRTEVVLKFSTHPHNNVDWICLIRTEVVLKSFNRVRSTAPSEFNKNRSCIEIGILKQCSTKGPV